MSNYPKVSIVTITYGHEDYILETIKGVFMQEYDGEIEFIIANDNSPDNTDQVIKEFLKSTFVPHNIEIKYTCHSFNKGMMLNFSWALNQANGKYIALCEGDDYWTDPLKLQKQVDFLEENKDIGACFTDATVINHFKNIQYNYNSNYRLVEGVVSNKDIYKYGGGIYHTASMIFKTEYKELLNTIKIDNIYGDERLIFNLTINNIKIAFLNFNSCVYNVWSGGVYSGLSSRELIISYRNEVEAYIKLLKLLNIEDRPYLLQRIKVRILSILNNSKFSLSDLKYIPYIGVRTFLKIKR